MENIGEWLREITAFALAVGASDEKHTEITVLEIYPMTLEVADGTLAVTCDRELPPEVQGVVDMAQLKQAVFGQARSAAMPALHEAREVSGRQWVRFQIPLYLDGLTRNELATAIWEVWKAQELLALQINGFKELSSLASEMEALEVGEEAPSEAVPAPSETAPPPEPEAPREPEAAQPPEAAPAPEPPSAPEPARTEAVPAGRFCTKCGEQAKPDQRFCIGCGSPLEGQA